MILNKSKLIKTHTYVWSHENTDHLIVFIYNEMDWNNDEIIKNKLLNDLLDSELSNELLDYAETNSWYNFKYKTLRKRNMLPNKPNGWYHEIYGPWYEEVNKTIKFVFNSLGYKLLEYKVEENDKSEKETRGTGPVPKAYTGECC